MMCMMTKLTNFIFAVFASMMVVACSNDDPVIPEITVAEGKVDYFVQPMDFPVSGGSMTLNFTSNVEWTLNASQTQNVEDWCIVSQNSGPAGSYDLTIVVEKNEGYDDRSIVLVLQAGNITKNVIVRQKQKDAILLATNKVEVDAVGGTIDVEVKSNITYDVEIPTSYRDWISLPSKARSMSSKNISFIIGESSEYEERIGEIYFKSGDVSEILKVVQSGSTILLVDKETFELEGGETVIEIELKSNTTYSVSISADWITEVENRSLSTSLKNFKIASNLTGKSREAKITFTTTDEKQKVDVSVIQATSVEAESLNLEFINTSGTLGGDLYIGMDYEFVVTAFPSNAVTDYEWKVEHMDIASIVSGGNSATLSTKNYGKSKVVVTDKITGISKSYEFATCVTDFQFEENSREAQYGYPVIKIELGGQYQLKYSCNPDYATGIFANLQAFNLSEINKSINTYVIVDKSSIIDINENGLITAKKIGTTIVEANNSHGVYKSGYNDGVFIEVVEEITPYGTIGGHGYVDLGLPSGKLWAIENFGGYSEVDYGAYYKWSSSDVVPNSWGSKWSTPTQEEFDELLNSCTYKWTSKNGVNGYLFIGKNGGELFLPAAGFKIYTEGYGYSGVQSGGSMLIYWSASKSAYTWEGHSYAYIMQGSSESITADVTYNTSITAAPIRPISR